MDSSLKTMKAAFLEKYGEKLTLKEIPIPEPKEGQVLVKVESSPINPPDLNVIGGLRPLPLPTQLGAEGFGTVVKAGDSKGSALVGKKVSFYVFSPNIWAQYALVGLSELMVNRLDVTPEQGACTYLNTLTTLGLVENVKKGNHKAVIITTAGACSRMLFRLFKEEGIKTIAVVRKEEQKKICLESDATYALNSSDTDFEEKLKKLAEEIGATSCIECVLGDLLGKILRAMPRRSEIIWYGKLTDNDPNIKVNMMDWLISETTIRPYLFIPWVLELGDEKREQVFEKIRNKLDDIFKTDISKTFKLEEINEAYEYYVKNMTQGKVVIKMN